MKAMLVHSKIIIELYYFAFINLIIFIIKAYHMFWHYTLLVFVWTLNIVITHRLHEFVYKHQNFEIRIVMMLQK